MADFHKRYPWTHDLKDNENGNDRDCREPLPEVDRDAYKALLMASDDRRAILRWFTQTRIDAGNGTVYAMSQSVRDYIESHFLALLSTCFCSGDQSHARITFVSDERLSAPRYKVPLEDIARKCGLAEECRLDKEHAEDNREPDWWQRDTYYY